MKLHTINCKDCGKKLDKTNEKPNTYIKEPFLSIILAHSYRWQIILAEVGLRFSNGVPFVYNLI